jgi:ATP-dependent exoDNAse (exonuclease V) beta subunit
MSTLIDHAERERFASEHAKNISVIAPAGVGKTSSIVNRIVRIAELPEEQAINRLTRLIVVTYSVRAAQQMQQRAREALQTAAVSINVQRGFQRTFFGTIHSYCVRLLDRFGHYLGLPSPVGLLQDDAEFWHRFLLRGLGQSVSEDEHLRDLFHFYTPEKLYALGKQISPGEIIKVGPFPTIDIQRLLDYRDDALHAATKKTIVKAQEAALIWSNAWARGDRYRPLPKCPESDKAADFAEIWNATFAPVHHWLREAALTFGRRVANAYESFRLAEAVMTYDDQVRLALRVLELGPVRRELASEKLSVLIDEAQDTDPRQFEVLRRVAGMADESPQAADQSFCIVGDFQQAIYAPRSDLAVYRRVHEEVSAEPRGTSSRLSVTFRCDAAIIALVNRIFPSVLNGVNGQCAFETLVPRDDAGLGQTARWLCPDEPEHATGAKISADVRARHEARFIARRIQELGPAGLGASEWSQVAILCPRKNWLVEIQRELVALGLPVQLHSSNEQQGDRTAAAWLTSLIWITTHPDDAFEIAGVLREILGVSDSDMAVFTLGDGDRLRLDRPTPMGDGAAESALRNLREACAKANELPLHHAVWKIVEKTFLRERLISIRELENVDGELDDLLAVIMERSADGVTLGDLAQELRLGLSQANPGEEEIQDAIQLLTSHKSKGLEWQAVIVPYLFRPIESKSLPYPRLVSMELGQEMVCREKDEFARHAADFVSERERQQLQRLLYVMFTRAKHALVLVDDETLFSGRTRRGGWSAGDLLGLFGGENRATWTSIPHDCPYPQEILANVTSADKSAPTPAFLPDVSTEDIHQAVERAGQIPRRITPHALAIHARHEAEPEALLDQEEGSRSASPDSPGILYGTWWHEFVQTIPWKKSATAWQEKFVEAQLHSPQPERAAREWELLRHSTMAQWLAEPGRLIQVEIPFLWPNPDKNECLEGVIDLAVYSEAESGWRVIDWKTNRIESNDSAQIVEIYRGQIEAYVRALRQILSAEVRGSLYLTQTGEWLPVE